MLFALLLAALASGCTDAPAPEADRGAGTALPTLSAHAACKATGRDGAAVPCLDAPQRVTPADAAPAEWTCVVKGGTLGATIALVREFPQGDYGVTWSTPAEVAVAGVLRVLGPSGDVRLLAWSDEPGQGFLELGPERPREIHLLAYQARVDGGASRPEVVSLLQVWTVVASQLVPVHRVVTADGNTAHFQQAAFLGSDADFPYRPLGFTAEGADFQFVVEVEHLLAALVTVPGEAPLEAC